MFSDFMLDSRERSQKNSGQRRIYEARRRSIDSGRAGTTSQTECSDDHTMCDYYTNTTLPVFTQITFMISVVWWCNRDLLGMVAVIARDVGWVLLQMQTVFIQ